MQLSFSILSFRFLMVNVDWHQCLLDGRHDFWLVVDCHLGLKQVWLWLQIDWKMEKWYFILVWTYIFPYRLTYQVFCGCVILRILVGLGSGNALKGGNRLNGLDNQTIWTWLIVLVLLILGALALKLLILLVEESFLLF